MACDDWEAQLREKGVVLLRDVFRTDSLTGLKEAATRCFEAIEITKSIPSHFHFNPFSHSVLLAALSDFGCSRDELLAPISAPGVGKLFSACLGGNWVCKIEHSWVRKKFIPQKAPSPLYHPQSWHQDGALGARFSIEPGPVIPMTELLTFWIPLNPCGVDSPGLEFVRRIQPNLLHFTELDDSALRHRFAPQEFCAPSLEFGDGLIFLNSVLHRTYARPEMLQDRLSVEYRIFPG